MTYRTFIFNGVFLGLLLLLKCQGHPSQDLDPSSAAQDPLWAVTLPAALSKTSWRFLNFSNSAPDQKIEPEVTLVFGKLEKDNLPFWGKGPINRYGGAFSIQPGKTMVYQSEKAIATLMASLDPEKNQLENHYHNQLGHVQFAQLTGDTLRLLTGSPEDPKTITLLFLVKPLD